MLKSMNFFRGKSRGRVGGGTKSTPPAPVILGPVPRILLQQGTNLVNKLALLLNKCRLREDSWDKPKNDGCWGRGVGTFSQSGRSMIEMLGVLAIIAVLSVGGIAGYSKAMLMWHSNKQKDLLATLINNAITLKPNLSTLRENRSQTITDVFIAMGGVPEGFTYQNNVIYDADNNSISITYGIDYDRQRDDSLVKVFKYAIRISAIEGTGKLSISMKEYCKNLIMAAQSAPNEVLSVDFSSIDSDSWSGTSGALIFNRSTRGQTSPAQINERCNIAIKENGRGYFRILLNPN